MKYVRFRVWVLFAVLITIVVLLFKWSAESGGIYKSSSPVTDSAITAAYPELYQAIYQRDANGIKPFLSHEIDTVRSQAWRTLATTPVDSPAPYVELAQQQNSEVAWFALSKYDFEAEQLRTLEGLWKDQPELRPGIARVLGQQGDQQSLDILLDAINTDISQEYEYALALSRLLIRFEVEEEQQIRILQKAFDASQRELRRAYLYGWYRGAETPLQSAAQDTLRNRWREQGMGIDRTLDQYVNALLPAQTTYLLTNFYNGEQNLEHEVQLAVELARSVRELDLTDRNALAAKILLIHPNPHVQGQTLKSLTGKLTEGDNLYQYINRSMVSDATLSHSVWLRALQAAATVDEGIIDDHAQRIERIVEENPYLLSQILQLWQINQPVDEYIRRVRSIVDRENPLATMQVLQAFDVFWDNVDEAEQSSSIIEEIRQLIFKALDLRDRGVAYTVRPLLEDEALFGAEDFQRINETLTAFSLPEDIEVYQQFGALYRERFEEKARPVIDSLAALNYAPLNRSLANAGWEVEIPEEKECSFRTPNWERLWELGTDPVWSLRTEKGAIAIQLDPLRAPATVSAIDSLSRVGAYDGVPFHRVVPNFVIQGGDIERQDGFGGPDFILPTEALEWEFERGAVGIASAGTDTEGSQYFVMHQWAPHLNGNYTRFGRVVDGMDVVDRIEMGNKVLSTSWY